MVGRSEAMAILAVDIGGSYIKHGLWLNERLEDRATVRTPSSLSEFYDLIQVIINEHNAWLESMSKDYYIEGIAISAPGTVDTQAGIIKGISAVPYIHGFNIVEAMEERFKLRVTIENDANCVALAELYYGAAKTNGVVLFLVIGTGIGGAWAINKTLMKGPNLFGGEFGYMFMHEEKNYSQYGSIVNIVKSYNTEQKLSAPITGSELFDLALRGDSVASQYIERFYHHLARGIFNLLVAFDPEVVLIGGGISVREDIIQRLTEEIYQLFLSQGVSRDQYHVNLKQCQFTDGANLVGAVVNYNNQIN